MDQQESQLRCKEAHRKSDIGLDQFHDIPYRLLRRSGRQPRHEEVYRRPDIRPDQFNGMPYRLLGRSGLHASNVGLGTLKVGYPDTGDGARVDERMMLKILDRAIELGVTFWDTADRYPAPTGNAERVIGVWMKNNPDQRRNVVLATKTFWLSGGYTPNHAGLSRGNVLESVYASLERLNVDRLDLFYFHNFDPITPIEESLSAMEDLVRQDLVRYFGVSNFTVEQLWIYEEAYETCGAVRCRAMAVQNRFDILDWDTVRFPGTLEYATRRGMAFIPWSPLAEGLLTERYLDPAKVGPGDRLYDWGKWEETAGSPAITKVHRLAELAHRWGLELNQLAIAYMLTLPGMGPIIPSVESVEELESNAAAGRVALSEEQQREVKVILDSTM